MQTRLHLLWFVLATAACGAASSERPPMQPATPSSDAADSARKPRRKQTCEERLELAAKKTEAEAKLTAYRSACAAGCAAACDSAGTLRKQGPPELRNDSDAAALFERGCAAKIAHACVELGFMYRTGRGVAGDYEAAVKAYRSACDLNDGDGCAGIGDLARDRAGDNAAAAAAYAEGCDLGSGLACALLGDLYKIGRGVSLDPERALEFYERACEKDGCAGCASAARMLELSPADAPKVEAFEQKVLKLGTPRCDAGDAYHCSLLGDAYRDGRGIAKDPVRARKLYRTGCDGGIPRGCDGLKSLAPR
jgi:TPR repeat protein